MTSQPEKDCGGKDGSGMATRGRSQVPIIVDLFNLPDRAAKAGPNPPKHKDKERDLVSPEKGHDKGSINKNALDKNVINKKNRDNYITVNQSNDERGHDLVSPEKGHDKDQLNANSSRDSRSLLENLSSRDSHCSPLDRLIDNSS